MINNPLPRLDSAPAIRKQLLPYCRLKPGEVWEDPVRGHRVGCLDATNQAQIEQLVCGSPPPLAIHDPPYNLVAFDERDANSFVQWCRQWIDITASVQPRDASLYIWLGADQNADFQPLPELIIMMRETPYRSRSWITVRNQRGYGTQKNWMAIRQELLYYTKGRPAFDVEAEYTDIPKTLRGYYKEVGQKRTENFERGKNQSIRAGNVWVDIQQVFYRMRENVSGCYAQKPIKAIERIIHASSKPGDAVMDCFAHAGTTLIGCERMGRRCQTCDIDPLYCEITIRRLERYRQHGWLGWQNSNPFEEDAWPESG